jgi:hypothetical protein
MDRSSVERILGGMKGTLLSQFPDSLQEETLEKYAQQALPSSSPAEREDWKRYWREQIWRKGERLRFDHERLALPSVPAGQSFPGARAGMVSEAVRTPDRRRSRGKDPQLQKLRDQVRRVHESNYRLKQLDMVKLLDKNNVPRPPGAAWRCLTWYAAFTHRQYSSSVRKWLSLAKQGSIPLLPQLPHLHP